MSHMLYTWFMCHMILLNTFNVTYALTHDSFVTYHSSHGSFSFTCAFTPDSFVTWFFMIHLMSRAFTHDSSHMILHDSFIFTYILCDSFIFTSDYFYTWLFSWDSSHYSFIFTWFFIINYLHAILHVAFLLTWFIYVFTCNSLNDSCIFMCDFFTWFFTTDISNLHIGF